MKVASFNVNSLRPRLPVVLQWLTEQKPDILCVQETKVQDCDFPGDAFDRAGYQYVFRGQKAYNGVAIFSKTEIRNPRIGFDDEPADAARLITAQVGPLTVINTYVPQGDNPLSERFIYKLDWFKRLVKYFDRHFKPTQKLLWVGDLNVAPEAIDVYDSVGLLGHVCFCAEVQAALKVTMAWGFVDVFRAHCQDAGQYTFWDYRLRNSLQRNLGWRLDHIMATKPLAKKSTACYIDKKPRTADKPSDHTPIVAEFDV